VGWLRLALIVFFVRPPLEIYYYFAVVIENGMIFKVVLQETTSSNYESG